MMTQTVLVLLAVACGQTNPAARKPDAQLASPSVDGTYGFSIRPPKGWQVIRQRVPEARGVTLLRMVNRIARDRIEEIRLKQAVTTRAVPMEEMLETIRREFEADFSNVEVLSRQVREIAGRPGAFLAATFWREGFQWLRLEAIVERRPTRYCVLLYSGPAQARGQSEPLFQLVLASLRFLDDPASEAELREALAAGTKWLSEVKAEDLRKALVPQQFLKFEVDDRPVGFVRITEGEQTVKGRPGVRIRERGWVFESNGQARHMQTNLFLSFDGTSEDWKTSVTTWLPSRDARPAYLQVALEEGVRVEDVLLTSQVYQANQPTKQNPPIRLPETYISRALLRMLPRLVDDPSKPRRLAFSEFDHRREDLVIRSVSLKGAAELPSGVTRGKVYRIEQREGVSGAPSDLYVDASGRILMVQAGNLRMVPAKAKELERLFASRVAEAEGRMARLEAQYDEEQRRFNARPRP